MADADKPKTKPAEPERFVVEAHTTFEVFGSTVTFRQHQVVSDPREVQLAQEHNVPLRSLTPIR